MATKSKQKYPSGLANQRSKEASIRLADALRDTLSPTQLALIAAYLQPGLGFGANEDAGRGLDWFYELCVETCGGSESFNRLMDEVGI